MRTITKEWLKQRITDMEAARDEIPFGLDEDDSNTLAALRIALASLEAEPVAVRARWKNEGSGHGDWKYHDIAHRDALMADENRDCELIYSAPPAPVSVPDDVMAAMQKDARTRLDLNDFDGDKRGILDCLSDAEEALIEVVNRRAAMLQGAENAESRCTIQTAPALNSSPKNAESRCSDSPVIPDGWVMVPAEPTEEMCDVGHVGVDVLTGVTDENEYYSIYGKYAAKVYRAMIAAAPQQEVKS